MVGSGTAHSDEVGSRVAAQMLVDGQTVVVERPSDVELECRADGQESPDIDVGTTEHQLDVGTGCPAVGRRQPGIVVATEGRCLVVVVRE